MRTPSSDRLDTRSFGAHRRRRNERNNSVAASRHLFGQQPAGYRGEAFEQRQSECLSRVEVVETVAGMRASSLPDFGRELDAGRAGADDDDVHDPGSRRTRARESARTHAASSNR